MLTRRQADIIGMLGTGMEFGAIAERLGIARSTVADYMERARWKTGAKTTYQLCFQAGRELERALREREP